MPQHDSHADFLFSLSDASILQQAASAVAHVASSKPVEGTELGSQLAPMSTVGMDQTCGSGCDRGYGYVQMWVVQTAESICRTVVARVETYGLMANAISQQCDGALKPAASHR